MADDRPFRTGTLLALAAALAFGVTAPFVQRFGHRVGPFTTAGLLYAGAALASTLSGRGKGDEARVLPTHLLRIALAAVAGAFIAPTCLAFGLQRTSGTAASLMLNLEAVFTVLLAWVLLREHLGGRLLVALLTMLAGGLLIVVSEGLNGSVSSVGLLAVAAATLGWALDNVVLRPLADLEPSGVVLRKSAFGAVLSAGSAVALGERLPSGLTSALLVACGATGYSLSLRLYLLAQRRIGAGRTGSAFAVAPFVGAILAWAMGQGHLGPLTVVAGVLFGVGAYLHVTEHHEHPHIHDALEHEHAHRHDDGHHGHAHEPSVIGEHSHVHRHDALSHQHPHAPDAHHVHRHK